ncbi:formimidoylglutamate deiminase [Myceligenerans indicum]|uniref:Formimidoylglutamate deiminase n=1 Tax=Myceligenerans indicum TaxID=2593663 RepID=A0ABS1LIZ8_9MICO|nr:formimidoylglutamate deiminase [Myceligenerans indicum]MBL0886129.1 formimidoylglutamate deiminase [Myceligenerans indicum]
MSSWWCEWAWVGGSRAAAGVVVRTEGGRVTDVTTGVVEPPAGATRLHGLTLPAFANAHSHAFHRALRGRTHALPDDRAAAVLAPTGAGSFWTWREQMYRAAERLDPDSYHRLARALYAEMVLAGYGVVGEFHYLHHAPGGRSYADPNAMGQALVAAAADAGIRLTVLDTCYLTAGTDGPPLSGVQQRFGDGDADAWASRAEALAASLPGGVVRAGAAVHSVRAVPPGAIGVVAAWAERHGAPLHVHLSEQPRENADCLAAHGRTPTALLGAHGALGPRTTAVHATHLTADDVAALARSSTRACVTRTTERDLADGAPQLGELAAAGIGLAIGSDSNAVVDPFEEVRGLELDERVRTLGRGHLSPATLLHAGTREGYASLGWSGAARPGSLAGTSPQGTELAGAPSRGTEPVGAQRSEPAGAPHPANPGPAPYGGIRAGDPADLTVVSLDSVRMAGWTPGTLLDHAVFAATSSDVTDTIVGGRHVVRDGVHRTVPDTAAELRRAIAEVLDPGT